MNPSPIKNIYCVGLGGVGVSAVAKYFAAQGHHVRGSDASNSPIIDDAVRHGVVYVGLDNDPAHITPDIDMVIHTDACPPDHPELTAARNLQIPCQSFATILGQIMAPFPQRVAITGTNGKTTTTAMAGLLAVRGGLNPTVFVGSKVKEFDGNLLLGGKELMIAEADEYRNHFLHLHPTIQTITNIELDHVDFFPDLDSIREIFKTLYERVPANGHCIINLDDPICRQDFLGKRGVVTYGFDSQADLRIRDWMPAQGRENFNFNWRGQTIGPCTLHIPGKFNVHNAAAAVATALLLGVDPLIIPVVLGEYRGVWRRFEILNPGASVTVVSDYAHHPTAVRATLEGAREFFPGRRIVALFQPHHAYRLAALYHDFTECFQGVDELILVELYNVLGRDSDQATVSTEQLGRDVAARGISMHYADSIDQAKQLTEQLVRPGDVVLIMGAGDIWTIASLLAQQYGKT